MKRLAILALCGVASATAVESNITVTASGLDQFEGELIELGYTDPRSEAGFEVLAIAVIQDGDATLSVPVSEPMQVELNLLAGEPKEGLRARGIVEPGASHQVRWDSDVGALAFSGGSYDRLISGALAEPEETVAESLRSIYLKYEDPIARLLALHAAWQDGEDEEQMAVMAELESLLGASPTIELLKGLSEKRAAEIARAIKDFTAMNLAGEEVRLADVLGQNKYTLVEFWASWCGPCIAEIPHLKSAYERFNDQGFEILAFNLDDDREAWRQASEDDYDIQWLNVSDELAFESPVAQMYRVNAIPASFLVSSDGKTVGRHLRGGDLEYRLEELLSAAEPASE